MTYTIGIDPGPTESGFCVVGDGYRVEWAKKADSTFSVLAALLRDYRINGCKVAIACESIKSFGMAVGREVFETCYVIGELRGFARMHGIPFYLYPRQEYARSLCGCGKFTDALLRQALLLRFGGDKKGEPLFLLKGASDKRSAFAVACYHIDLMREKRGG